MAPRKPTTKQEGKSKKPTDLRDMVGNIKSMLNAIKGRVAKPDTKAKTILKQERLKKALESVPFHDSSEQEAKVNSPHVHFDEPPNTIEPDFPSQASSAADEATIPLTPPSSLHISHFEIGRPLGRGKFGRVFLARHLATNYICALKYLSKAHITSSKDEKLVRRELEIHQNVAHPNILRFLSWFHDSKNVYLVLEYACGGNLYDRLRQQPKMRFTENVAAEYVAQMVEALVYLHGKNIMHRDIKPENILMGLHGEIKVADFGYSIHSVSGLRSTVVGTLDYLSPEVAMMLIHPGRKHEVYTKAVDHWSVGVLAFELLTGKPPFEMKSRKATERKIGGFKNKVRFPGHVSKTAEEFIMALLKLEAEKRMSLEDVLEHPWITQHCRRKDSQEAK